MLDQCLVFTDIQTNSLELNRIYTHKLCRSIFKTLQANSSKISPQCNDFSDFEKSVSCLQVFARFLLVFIEILKFFHRPTKLLCVNPALYIVNVSRMLINWVFSCSKLQVSCLNRTIFSWISLNFHCQSHIWVSFLKENLSQRTLWTRLCILYYSNFPMDWSCGRIR